MKSIQVDRGAYLLGGAALAVMTLPFTIGLSLGVVAGLALLLAFTLSAVTLSSRLLAAILLFLCPLALGGFKGLIVPGWLPIEPQILFQVIILAILVSRPRPRMTVRAVAVAGLASALTLVLILATILNGHSATAILVPWVVGAAAIWVVAPFLATNSDLQLGIRAVTFALIFEAIVDTLSVGLNIQLPLFVARVSEVGQNSATGAAIDRFQGALGDYELLGEAMLLGVVLSFWLFLHERSPWMRATFALGLAFCAYVLLATGTRSAALLAAVGLFVVALVEARHRKLRVAAAFLLLLALIPFGRQLLDVVFQRISTIDTGAGIIPALGRLPVWQRVLGDPTILDMGPLGVGLPYPYEAMGVWPHSLFVTLFVVGGWLAALIGVVLAVTPPVLLWRSRSKSAADRSLAILLALAYSLLMLDQVKIEFVRLGPSTLLFFALLTLTVARLSFPASQSRPPGHETAEVRDHDNDLAALSEAT